MQFIYTQNWSQKKTKMTTKAIYAGSFDPLTNGHVDVIFRASKLFDQVVVAVGINPDKKYSLPIEHRLKIIQDACLYISNVTVVIMGNNLLVHFAKSINATHIIRGIRSHKDFDDESLMQRINKDIDMSVETVFFIPNKQYIDISSSLVKSLVGPKYWHYVVKNYVPKNVLDYLARKELEKICSKYPMLQRHMAFNIPVETILKNYRESHRFYHNELHILDTLNDLERVSDFCIDEHSIYLALLFHDIKSSEKESIEEFIKLVDNSHSRVCDFIEATDHKRLDFETFDNDEKIIHDIDLMILASSASIYNQYSENVFKEYNVKYGIERNEFNAKRKEFLESLLKRGKIFLHDQFYEFEDQARNNIIGEISSFI